MSNRSAVNRPQMHGLRREQQSVPVVETQAELDHLKREGCTEGQGYFFGKPQPAKAVHALLTTAKAGAIA